MSEAWAEMDAWCLKQLKALPRPSEDYLLKGGSLDNPDYREMLGRHQTLMRMRSYIHGAASLSAHSTAE